MRSAEASERAGHSTIECHCAGGQGRGQAAGRAGDLRLCNGPLAGPLYWLIASSLLQSSHESS